MFQLFATIDLASHKDEMRFPILADKQNLSRLLIDPPYSQPHCTSENGTVGTEDSKALYPHPLILVLSVLFHTHNNAFESYSFR